MLINNAETWTYITIKEMNEIEKMQKTILQRIFKIKRNTPYCVYGQWKLGYFTKTNVVSSTNNIR